MSKTAKNGAFIEIFREIDAANPFVLSGACASCSLPVYLFGSSSCACAKKSKFRNQRVIINGLHFASKAEAARYSVLLGAVKAGLISDLVLQPRYSIVIYGQKICDVVGDFSYDLSEGDVSVYEDRKGRETDLFRLKLKLLKLCYPDVQVRIIKTESWNQRRG